MENKDHFSNMRFLGVLRKRRQLEKISNEVCVQLHKHLERKGWEKRMENR